MCADAGLHPDQATRHGGKPCSHLAARPFLAQHDRATSIEAHDVERVLANINADHGDSRVEFLRHGALLVFDAPCQLLLLAGQEHGRTIPLADMGSPGFGWNRWRKFWSMGVRAYQQAQKCTLPWCHRRQWRESEKRLADTGRFPVSEFHGWLGICFFWIESLTAPTPG